jgi:hypothetical protein
MTVRELIEWLQGCPQDIGVFTPHYSDVTGESEHIPVDGVVVDTNHEEVVLV